MAAVKGRRQPGSPRRRTTRTDVVAAAVEIVDRDGVDALTIRRVADACGLSPMGVYRHVRDKDDLLDRIVDAVVGIDLDDIDAADPWDAQVTELFGRMRGLFLDHPGVAVLCVLRPTPVVGVARFYDRVLRALEAGGHRGKRAVHAFDTLLMFTFGSVLWQVPRSSDVRRRLVTVALDDAGATNLVARSRELGHRDPTEYFEAGLRVIVEGIRTSAPRRRARSPARTE
jgi:AcrR family transcriptional regulator